MQTSWLQDICCAEIHIINLQLTFFCSLEIYSYLWPPVSCRRSSYRQTTRLSRTLRRAPPGAGSPSTTPGVQFNRYQNFGCNSGTSSTRTRSYYKLIHFSELQTGLRMCSGTKCSSIELHPWLSTDAIVGWTDLYSSRGLDPARDLVRDLGLLGRWLAAWNRGMPSELALRPACA